MPASNAIASLSRRDGDATRATPLLAVLSGLLLALASPATGAQGAWLPASEAAAHIGERQKVCGTVASARYADDQSGTPTFLNLDEPFPAHIFTVVIWEENRWKFDVEPEDTFRGRCICVSGQIGSYAGTPRIVVEDPGQIEKCSEAGLRVKMPQSERFFQTVIALLTTGLGALVTAAAQVWLQRKWRPTPVRRRREPWPQRLGRFLRVNRTPLFLGGLGGALAGWLLAWFISR